MWQSLFNNILNRLVKVALWFYFSKIEVKGSWKAYKDEPMIIIANHQNALLDALHIATYIDLKPYFLARASVFKNPIIARLLAFIRMVPVYRIRDGFGSIPGNKTSFSFCEAVLKKNGKVLIFPEGNHSLKRQVRPLSKGFTRIVAATLLDDPTLDLKILPIGINYQAHQKSGTKVLLEVGTPIKAIDYIGEEKKLVKQTEQALKSLTLHLPEANYNKALKTMLQSNQDITSHRLELMDTIKTPFKSPPKWRNLLFKVFHLPLWLVWELIKPKVKDTVFYGTIKFCLGLVGIPLYYLSVIVVLSTFSTGSTAIICSLLMLITLKFNRNFYNQSEEDLLKS